MKRRWRRALWPLVAFFVVLAVFLVAFSRGLAPVGHGGRVIVSVGSGATVGSVLGELEARHAIRSARWARLYSVLTGIGSHHIVKGLYEVPPTHSAPQVLRSLMARLGAVQRITIPEGRNMHWIAAQLERKGVCSRAEFLAACSQPAQFAKAVTFPLPGNGLEGYLFPDTYYMAENLGAQKAVIMMLQDFDRRALQAGLLPGRELANVVNVASMVELEARIPKDRPLIAGVVRNRLAKGMPLEIDAAVLYGLGTWKKRVLLSDLHQDTPYNTYLHKGLPPTPICNPGLPSLLAAAKPATHQYLYYVARLDGSHAFSTTYAEHLHNKRLARMERARAN